MHCLNIRVILLMFYQEVYEVMFTIETGSGFWTPIVWVIAAVVILLLLVILRGRGRSDSKVGAEKLGLLMLDDREIKDEQKQLKNNSLFWGFVQNLSGVYSWLEKIFQSNIRDYVLWFVVILGVLFIIEVM